MHGKKETGTLACWRQAWRWRFSLKMPHMCQRDTNKVEGCGARALHIRLQDIWQLQSKALKIYKICMQQTMAPHSYKRTKKKKSNKLCHWYIFENLPKTLVYSHSRAAASGNAKICRPQQQKTLFHCKFCKNCKLKIKRGISRSDFFHCFRRRIKVLWALKTF